MRPFTISSFHDNEGNLLHGRLKFYDKNKTEKLADIFDENGHVLPNPIFTNNIGQTVQQVFLDDIDYRIQFEKYIGDGEMEYDQSNWVFQYSAVNLYNTFDIDITSNSVQVITDMATLKETDPIAVAELNGTKVINLVGYYEQGDKPAVMYYWDEESTETANDGSIVKVDGIDQGRWILVPNQSDYVDVRHFGLFPTNNYTELNPSDAYKAMYANIYSMQYGLTLYFPGTKGTSYYVAGYSLYDVVVDKNVHFAVMPDLNITINLEGDCGNFHVMQCPLYVDGTKTDRRYNGQITISGDELYLNTVFAQGEAIDWSKITFAPTAKMHLNRSGIPKLSFSGITVKFYPGTSTVDQTANYVTLDNCVIDSNRAIGQDLHVAFRNCEIREVYFADSNMVTNYSFENCYSNIDYWTDTDKYINFWKRNKENVLDFHERQLTRDFVVNGDAGESITIKNLQGNGKITFTSDVKYISIVDSSANIAVSSGDTTLIINNSTVTSNSLTYDLISAYYSSVIFNNSTGSINVNTLETKNGDIHSTTANQTIIVHESFNMNGGVLDIRTDTTACTAVLDGVYVNDVLNCKTIDATNCTFTNQIIQVDDNQNFVFNISNCRFEANGLHYIMPVYSNCHVNGRWCNNVSVNTTGTFIKLDRMRLDPKEKNHNYVYENNSGPGAIPSKVKWTDTLTKSTSATYRDASAPRMYYVDTVNNVYRGCTNMLNVKVGDAGTTDPSIFATEFRLFTVGTDLEDIPVICTIMQKPTHFVWDAVEFTTLSKACTTAANPYEVLDYSSRVGTPKQIMFNEGYTWRLYNIPLGYVDPSYSVYGTNVTAMSFNFEAELLK